MTRSESRFSSDDQGPTVEIRTESESWGAESVDISSNGAKIRMDRPLLFEQKVELSFASDESELCVAAEVRWIRPLKDGWLVGFSLNDQVPESFVEELSRSGQIDRRIDPRILIEVEGRAQIAGASERFPIKIRDYSKEGVRMELPECCKVGDRLRVWLKGPNQDPSEILVNVKWTACGDVAQCGGEVAKNTLTKFRDIVETWEEQSPRGWGLLPNLMGGLFSWTSSKNPTN